MRLNQIDENHFSAIAASFNPALNRTRHIDVYTQPYAYIGAPVGST